MQDYKPQFMHWKLVLLTRKLVFALVVVLLNHAVEAQVRFGGLNSSFYFKFFVVLASCQLECIEIFALHWSYYVAVAVEP